jgi:IS605 OrfB family transposase
MASDIQPCVRTLRLKVKREGYDWLDAAATEVNQVWNFSNAASYKAARPFAGQPRWLSAFDLDKLTAGATECFERIGSETIQRVNAEFATRRKQFRKARLRWRVSQGSKRSLGWIPFKRQAKRLHRTAARRRKDALHKFSTKLIATYQTINIGDVSSLSLAKTRMAKSVLNAGWGMLKTQLHYKGQQAGRCVQIVSERNTTRTCSSCKALTGPAGLDMLVIRSWVCSACGDTHDRDVNAARNILTAGRSPPSVRGNEPPLAAAPPSPTSSRCEAATGALKAAA